MNNRYSLGHPDVEQIECNLNTPDTCNVKECIGVSELEMTTSWLSKVPLGVV